MTGDPADSSTGLQPGSGSTTRPADPATDTPRATRDARLYLWLVSGLILVQGLWIFNLNRRSFILVDDYLFLQQAIESDLSVDYLRTDMFGHFSPLLRIVYKLMATFASGQFIYFAIVLALFAAGVIAAVAFMIRQISTRPIVLWYAVITVGFAIWTLRPALVFTNGIHVLLATGFSTLAVAFFIRLCVTGSRRSLWAASAAYLLAVLVQEKPLLLPLTLVLLRYGVLAETSCPLRRLPRQVVRDWSTWAPLFVIWLLSAINQIAFYRPNVAPASVDDVIETLGLSARAFVQSLAGFWGDVLDPPWRVAACWLVLLLMVAFVAWTSWARRGAWIVWALFAVVYLANFALLAWGRVGLYGPSFVLEANYYLEVGVCWVMCVALALRRPLRRAALDGRARSADSWPAVAILTLLIAIFLPHVLVTAPRFADRAIGSASAVRDYLDNANGDLDRLRQAGQPFDVVPTLAPPAYIFAGITSPYTELVNVLRIFHRPVEPVPAGGRPVIVDDAGVVRDTRPVVLDEWTDPGQGCSRVEPGGQLEVPITASSSTSGLWLVVRYTAESDATAQVTGFDNSRYFDTALPTGLDGQGTLAIARIPDPAIDAVRIRLLNGGPVCIATVAAVELVAADPATPDRDPGAMPGECWLVDQTGSRVQPQPCPASWGRQFP